MRVVRPLRLPGRQLSAGWASFGLEVAVLTGLLALIAGLVLSRPSEPGSLPPGNQGLLFQVTTCPPTVACFPTPSPTSIVSSTIPATTAPPTTVPPTTVPPTTTLPPTTVPPTTTAAPTVTTTPQPQLGEIGGLVLVDDRPTAGFVVVLSGSGQRTTGADGRYRFGNLTAGTYGVSVNYDHQKYAALSQDRYTQTLAPGEIQTGVTFRLKSLQTPSPTITPASTQSPTYNPKLTVSPKSGLVGSSLHVSGSGWNPRGPDGNANGVTVLIESNSTSGRGSVSGFSLNAASLNAPLGTLGVLPVSSTGEVSGDLVLKDVAPQQVFITGQDLYKQTAQAPFAVEGAPQCPMVGPGQKLRLATKFVNRTTQSYWVCVQVIAGADGVNLNDTVIEQFPQGSTVTDASAGTGTVSINGSTVRWGGFSLAAQQSTSLLVSVTPPNNSLTGTSIFISGRFNRGQSFQQRYDGLPPLVEIDVAESGATSSTPSGQAANIPQAAPATGNAPLPAKETDPPLMLVGLLAVWLLTLGWLIRRRWRRV